MLFLKSLHRLVHLLAGHAQECFLQSQGHVRIGQGFLSLPELAPAPRRFVNFFGLFHANDFAQFAAAQLSNPTHHRASALDLVFALHAEGTTLTAFHLSDDLQFEPVTVSNHFHDTGIFSFQSTNLFQEVKSWNKFGTFVVMLMVKSSPFPSA
jgi:hypothetical protein